MAPENWPKTCSLLMCCSSSHTPDLHPSIVGQVSNEVFAMNRNAAFKAALPEKRRRAQAGFSLIELLIVVAIILIIAAIAIPALVRAKIAANEASAAESVRTITTGETTYSTSCPDIGYSASLMELNTGAICASGKNIIDEVLGGGDPSFRNGYKFIYVPVANNGSNTTFTITALPIALGISGNRGFLSDQTGVIRYSLDGTSPLPTSSPLQ
jgi:type IV pilus assembly protein PilA